MPIPAFCTWLRFAESAIVIALFVAFAFSALTLNAARSYGVEYLVSGGFQDLPDTLTRDVPVVTDLLQRHWWMSLP